MTQLRRSIFALMASYALLAGCGESKIVQPPVDTTKPAPPPPTVIGVVISGKSRLTVGRVDTLTAAVQGSAGGVLTGKTVTWASSNPTVVLVGATDGIVRALNPGTATISATVDGVVGSYVVTSGDASLTSLTLSGPTTTLVVGGTRQFTAAGRDSVNQPVAIRTITWRTSDPRVATVTQTGLVTAVGLGTVVISADGVTVTAATASVNVTVIAVPTSSVAIAPLDTLLRFRFPKQIVATARDSAGNPLVRPFTYTTSNVDVAVLDDFGLVTATGQGPVTITATSGGRSASVRLFVPSDSGLYVAVTGGVPGDLVTASYDIPNGSSPASSTSVIPADQTSRFNFLVSNGNYRVRASTTVDTTRGPVALSGYALQLGSTTASVPVTIRPPSTVVSVPLRPYTATISAPTTVAVNSTVTVTWTFDEATEPFSFFPDQLPTGTLHYSTTNGADLSGTPLPATVVRDANGRSVFSATFTAPGTPGTIYFQVAADGAVARLLFPIVFRGQALRTITVQ